MAKPIVFTYKIQGDTGDVEKSITTIDGFNQRIAELQNKLATTDFNAPAYKEYQKELKRTEGAYEGVKNANKSWLEVVAGAPGIIGTLGQSIQGAGKLFGSLNMAFKTSVIGIIATVVGKLVEKFSQMEGVLDPLNKITGIFSATIGKLANFILPPISATLEAIASGAESVINFFSELAGGSSSLGDELGQLEERQDSLSDSQAEYELGIAKANRALQEAREIAGDSTKSIGERKKALQDAAKLENEIAEKGKVRALEQARITAEQIAQSLNLSQQEIKNLRAADAQYLESFATRIAAQKGLNQEQRTALLKQLGEAEDIAAGQAKIEKKTNTQIKALDSEAAASAKQAATERRNARKSGIDAEIKLLTQFQDTTETKDKDYYDKIKQQLIKYYTEKNKLEDADKKLSDAERKVRQKEQEKAIKDAIGNLQSQASKQKQLDDQLIESSNNVAKAKQKETTDVVEQIKIQQKELDDKYTKDAKRLEDDLANAEQTYGKDSEQFKNAQIAKNNAEAAYLTKKKENDTKIVDAEKAKKDAILSIDDVLNQQLTSQQKDGIDKQVKEIKDGGQKKIEAYKKQLDEAVKIGALTVEDAAAKLKTFTASVAQNVKDTTQAAIGQDFLDTIKNNLDAALSGASTSYTTTVNAIEKAQLKLDEAYKAGKISEYQYTQASLDNQNKLKTARAGVVAAMDAAAKAAGDLANAFGQETAAGKVLIKVQQAITLSTTAMALADSIAGLGKDIKKGFPTNVIAVASTLSLIATVFSQAKALFAKSNTTSESGGEGSPRKLASGGIVSGPGTSTSDSIPASLSNGESVINANSTAMFAPILSAINQAGGGKPFAFGGIASTNDLMQQQTNSLVASLGGSGNEPIKTYVVASDMSSMQMFDRAQKSRSTL
jgi:hypothetical protein